MVVALMLLKGVLLKPFSNRFKLDFFLMNFVFFFQTNNPAYPGKKTPFKIHFNVFLARFMGVKRLKPGLLISKTFQNFFLKSLT
jgi:hypothetical protein